MRFKPTLRWENWFAWYPVWVSDIGQSVWLEWTHRYPDYYQNVRLGYTHRLGKKPLTR